MNRGLLLVLVLALLPAGLFAPARAFAELDDPPRGNAGGALAAVPEPLSGTERAAGAQARVPVSAEQTVGGRETAFLETLRRWVLVSISWIFLVVGLALVLITLKKTHVWLKAVQKAARPPTRVFNLQLKVRNPAGDLSLHNFDYYPIIVASHGTADLILPSLAGQRDRFRIDYRQGQACLVCETPLIVNGVPRQEKQLKEGDRILFGAYRLDFRDASVREHGAPLPSKPVFAWQFPIVALLLALSVMFRQAGAEPKDTVLARAEERKDTQVAAAARPAAQQPGARVPAAGRTPPVRPAERASAREGGSPATPRPAVPPSPEAPRSAPVRPAPAAAERIFGDRLSGTAVEESVTRLNAPQPATPRPATPRPVAAAPRVVAPRGALQPATPASVVERELAAALQASVLGSVKALDKPEQPEETAALAAAPTAPEKSREPEQPLRAAPEDPDAATPRPATPQPAAPQTATPQLAALNRAVAEPGRALPEPRRIPVRVVAPGRPIEFFQADVLFIHAHPDDESIDFGALMAKGSRSGMRIATLLFTDGESGLDLYPQRKIGDIYPARPLEGSALSQVRVVEATRALSILGSESYVRWGLGNHVYNSKRDELSLEEVLKAWGGEDELLDRLIGVIEGFHPAVVVSPDRHSGAYEHFEHEAVGYLVGKVLEQLRLDGCTYLKGHLVSVDPYQKERYPRPIGIDALEQDPESGMPYRATQAQALREHVTQRDAALIAVSRLSHLPLEYYQVQYWELPGSVEDFFK